MTADRHNLALLGPGFAIATEERIERSLNGTLPPHIPALKTTKIDAVSRARIRRAFAELAQGNMEEVQEWLHAVAAGERDSEGQVLRTPNPARAIELFIELAKFTTPQVKAVSVDVTDKTGTKRYSMADLQSIVSEQ